MAPHALAHLASVPLLALVVAFIFSLNLQGPRGGGSVVRGTLRRFVMILALMAYGMLVVHLLTRAAQQTGAWRVIDAGIAIALVVVLVFLIFFPSGGAKEEAATAAQPEDTAPKPGA